MEAAERIVVVGRAERTVAPDAALLSARVLEVDGDKRAAFGRCAARVNDVVARLRAVVGRDGDVTTGQVSLEPDYEGFQGDGVPRRHAASCIVDIDCDPARAADAVAEAVEIGADRLSGPRFLLRDRAGLTEELLAEAVGVARRKAERLAAAVEGSVGSVVSIEELVDGRALAMQEAGMARPAAGGGVDLRPAAISVAVYVQVAFALAGPGGRSQ